MHATHRQDIGVTKWGEAWDQRGDHERLWHRIIILRMYVYQRVVKDFTPKEQIAGMVDWVWTCNAWLCINGLLNEGARNGNKDSWIGAALLQLAGGGNEDKQQQSRVVFSTVILPGYELVAVTWLGNALAAGHYTLWMDGVMPWLPGHYMT
jgi:hypothetical protein